MIPAGEDNSRDEIPAALVTIPLIQTSPRTLPGEPQSPPPAVQRCPSAGCVAPASYAIGPPTETSDGPVFDPGIPKSTSPAQDATPSSPLAPDIDALMHSNLSLFHETSSATTSVSSVTPPQAPNDGHTKDATTEHEGVPDVAPVSVNTAMHPLNKDFADNFPPVVQCNLVSGSLATVPVTWEGFPFSAVIDSGAQKTIVSDVIYNKLKVKPSIIKKIAISGAGRDMAMTGYLLARSRFRLGNKTFYEHFIVAPIGDDMLLGFDFLNKHGMSLSYDKNELQFDDSTVKVYTSSSSAIVTDPTAAEETDISLPRICYPTQQPSAVEKDSGKSANTFDLFLVNTCESLTPAPDLDACDPTDPDGDVPFHPTTQRPTAQQIGDGQIYGLVANALKYIADHGPNLKKFHWGAAQEEPFNRLRYGPRF